MNKVAAVGCENPYITVTPSDFPPPARLGFFWHHSPINAMG